MTCGMMVIFVTVLATVGLAQILPRLPEDLTFRLGKTSPGQVTFRHQTHVNQKLPDCTVCHPSPFKILGKGSSAEGELIGHSSCQGCHNGSVAFGTNNCTVCHRGQ
jgi:c(7)-type cytochrome triheme protein